MPRIAGLLGRRNIAKNELVEARMTSNVRVDQSEGEKNSPRYEPNREHDADHHTQETDKKVAVQSIDILNTAIICIKDRNKPSKEMRR
jgi:hypothetical protein